MLLFMLSRRDAACMICTYLRLLQGDFDQFHAQELSNPELAILTRLEQPCDMSAHGIKCSQDRFGSCKEAAAKNRLKLNESHPVIKKFWLSFKELSDAALYRGAIN